MATNGLFKERILIVGTGTWAQKIAEEIRKNSSNSFEIVGFVDEKREKSERPSDLPIIGDFSQISSICREAQVDRIIVALDERRGKLPLDQLLECRLRGVRVEEGIAFSEYLAGKLTVENLRPSSLILRMDSEGLRLSNNSKDISISAPLC
jgi:FlaA1/EpsC-like NDP-sugar epimerase